MALPAYTPDLEKYELFAHQEHVKVWNIYTCSYDLPQSEEGLWMKNRTHITVWAQIKICWLLKPLGSPPKYLRGGALVDAR